MTPAFIHSHSLAIRFTLLVLLLLPLKVMAEGGCPPGMVPAQGNNLQSCMPIPPGYQPQPPPPPPPPPVPHDETRQTWGALAADATGGTFGAAVQAQSEDDAREAAVSDCRFYGGVGCRATRTFHNECLAVVTHDTTEVYGTGTTEDVAVGIGMNQCQKDHRNGCTVIYAACSGAITVKVL